jgi:hypothetical protein
MESLSWEINETDHGCWDKISGKIHRRLSDLCYVELTVLSYREISPIQDGVREQVSEDEVKNV